MRPPPYTVAELSDWMAQMGIPGLSDAERAAFSNNLRFVIALRQRKADMLLDIVTQWREEREHEAAAVAERARQKHAEERERDDRQRRFYQRAGIMIALGAFLATIGGIVLGNKVSPSPPTTQVVVVSPSAVPTPTATVRP